MPEAIETWLDYVRIVIDLIAIVIFSIGVYFPVKNTIIPYWKKFGPPSTALFSRLAIRISLLVLVIYNLFFPVLRLFDYQTRWLGRLSVPIFGILALMYLYSWWKHPNKLDGL